MRGEPEFIPDREKLTAIFEKYAPLVDELRHSSRHDLFVPDYDYEAGLNSAYPTMTESIRTAKFLSGLADFQHEEGRDGPASELLTLGLAMAHDTGRSGTIIHFLVMITAETIEIESMREILAGHAFEAADLESFARKMDRLWEARPSVADALDVEDATIRRTIVAMGTGEVDLPSLKIYESQMHRSWRYLFSHRLAYAGALAELEEAWQEARAISALAPHLRPAAMTKVAERTLASKNPVVSRLYPAIGRVYLRDNVSRLRWTLMRVATAIAWYESEKGQVPERLEELVPRYLPRVPTCPLTGLPLGYRRGTMWSVGKNGVDDGGTSGKNDDADDEDGDVVWRVTRE